MTDPVAQDWPDERADPRVLETIDALFEPRRMNFDEYWAFERESPRRHEFVDGEVYLMVGARDVHELIKVNLAVALHRHRGDRFDVFANGMRIRILGGGLDRSYYPDVAVTLRSERDDAYFRHAPVVLAEVLSPSTRLVDKGQKFEAYKTIPALSEYLLVEPDRIEATLHERANNWAPRTLGPGERIPLASMGAAIPVDEIYDGIKL